MAEFDLNQNQKLIYTLYGSHFTCKKVKLVKEQKKKNIYIYIYIIFHYFFIKRNLRETKDNEIHF